MGKLANCGLWGSWTCFAVFATLSCSGGSSGGAAAPAVSFSLANGSGAATEGGAALNVEVVLATTRAMLGEEVTIEVTDLASGSATPGNDYLALGTQLLTFPATAVNGERRSVQLSALTDASVEGPDESVRLRLQSPSVGVINGTRNFVASIEDAEVATIHFVGSQSTTGDETSGDHVVSVELELAPGVDLLVDATVRVSDSGQGSASSGVDYEGFATRLLTFPAGSLDGETRTVTLSIRDDGVTETDETAILVLDSPTPGAQLGANATHQVTILDDDASVASAFVASEGGTGVENSLDHEELVNLGSATVGAGPNAGTSLRITNAGGSSLSLAPPIIVGTNAEDFILEIELAPLAPPAAMQAPHEMTAPMEHAAASAGPGIALTLVAAGVLELEQVDHVRLYGFPVPGRGEVTLELERVPLPIGAGAQLLVNGIPQAGGLHAAAEGLSMWSGSAVELDGSHAFLSFSNAGPTGFLQLGTEERGMVHVFTEQSVANGPQQITRVVHEDDLLALGANLPDSLCGGERFVPGQAAQSLELASQVGPNTEALTASNCRLAIETDYQLFQQLGSESATTNYVIQLIAAISDRYFTDIQTTLSIEHLAVYTNAGDPWTSQDSGGDAGDLLDEFRDDWNADGWPVAADLAHFISGATLGGGVAYVNVLCNQFFGYGVSGNVRGNINWGTWSGNPGSFTWDFVVVAHELGHNFGANHTHSYCPPLDHCYSNCDSSTSCSQGTIMSYCHTCGGMDNIDLEFHPSVANIMRQRVDSSCLGNAALAGGDYVQYLVRFRPLSGAGSRSATLEFDHDAGNAPRPFQVHLSGTAQ